MIVKYTCPTCLKEHEFDLQLTRGGFLIKDGPSRCTCGRLFDDDVLDEVTYKAETQHEKEKHDSRST